jgi:DNA gyrase/topoisomerase IV subunit A
VAYQIARERFIKSARVDGHVTGNYHPHGSIYGTIVQLVRQGFLEGQGNFGCNVGVEPVGPAAMRYTEIKLSKQMIDFAFKYVKYVDWFENELEQKEPFSLPVMLPMCLIGREYTQGIGFGYKTYIPCYSMKDLYRRLQWLKGLRKTKPTIAPLTDCNILSEKRQLENLLTKGKARIEVEGRFDIDYRTHRITLYSWPPGKKFETILKNFAKELDSNSIGFTDLSTDQTEIVFQVLKDRNRDKILREFEPILKNAVRGFITFENNVIDVDRVTTKPIDEMLDATYEMFKDTNEKMLLAKAEELIDARKELISLGIMREPLQHCMSKNMNLFDSVDFISKKTKLSKPRINELLSKYKIRKLLTMSTDTKQIEKEVKQINEILQNIEPYIIEQYDKVI